MSAYVNWVESYPILSAIVQFAILGTIGEIISNYIRKGTKAGFPFKALELLGKMIAWAALGAIIKYAFVGFVGFHKAIMEHSLLPAFFALPFFRAFFISASMNILFGPQMMFFHRLEDSILAGQMGFSNMKRPILTLLWFWIPAHTVTFLLPPVFRIGPAALWSIVLGVILGWYARRA